MKCIQSKFKNHFAVLLKKHFCFRQSNEFELKLSRVLLTDAGNYTCKASNDIGEDESEVITVDSEFLVLTQCLSF